MGQYTELLDDWAATIDPMEDDYQEKLLEVASIFRGFNDALTSFIVSKGFDGSPDDVNEKVDFIKNKFKCAGIKMPRNIDTWFLTNKKRERKTAFQICFALGLDVDETNDFFRRVMFERSFDCHTLDEAVYYFCMKNGLDYLNAEKIITRIDKIEKAKTIPKGEVLYTRTIVDYIDSISSEEQLVEYISDNASSFAYNNATAIRLLQNLWAKIEGPEGLARKEGALIEQKSNFINSNLSKKQKEKLKQKKKLKQDDDHIVGDNEKSSTWTIYAQIIGLDEYQKKLYAKTRSLAPVLTENVLVPLKASECFPSRQNIDNILRGKTVDHEQIRKLIIFLAFYSFWAKKIIDANDVDFYAKSSDGMRCMDMIDKYLLDAGYPSLYYGNPYDWIFMWALNDEQPLETFRGYVLEIFDAKEQ